MSRYFMELSYKGTRYHGWQIQPNASTVQQKLEHCMGTFLRHPVSITGAGRTDTGVHAAYYVAHFDAIDLTVSCHDLAEKLNRFLPNDIALHRIWLVPSDAHARFSAISRTYQYRISRAKNPFTTEFSWHYHQPLDVDAMNGAAQLLLGISDFTSFSKLHTDVETNLCNVTLAEWVQNGHQLVFTISANRFLRNMVRALAGTLIEVGKGRMLPADVLHIAEKLDRSAAGTSLPAAGLFLTGIGYPSELGATGGQSSWPGLT